MAKEMKVYNGSDRRVLLIDRLAIKWPKVSSFRAGLIQSRREIRWWLALRDNRLCPIVCYFFGGIVVVMKRATHLTEEQYKEKFPTYDSMIEYFDNSHIYSNNSGFNTTILPHEAKIDSFGMLDEKLVAVDYGNDDLPINCKFSEKVSLVFGK